MIKRNFRRKIYEVVKNFNEIKISKIFFHKKIDVCYFYYLIFFFHKAKKSILNKTYIQTNEQQMKFVNTK